MGRRPSQPEREADVPKKPALERKTDERPVPGVQWELAIGPSHIGGKQKATPARPPNKIAEITSSREMHFGGYAQKGLLWSAPIDADPGGGKARTNPL